MILRITRDAALMDCARVWSQRSTCDRAHVGAVFSRDGRILVTGYNGAPAGMPHCSHPWHLSYARIIPEKVWDDPSPCLIAVHAEANGVAWAAREGVRLFGAEVHTTVSPCHGCAKLLINAGLVRVTYAQAYGRGMEGVELLRAGGIEVRSAD